MDGGIVVLPWLFFSLRLATSLVGLVATLRTALPVPPSPREPLLTHASTGGPPTLAGRSSSASSGVTTPFPEVLVHIRFCLCPLGVESVSPSPVEAL